MEVDVCFAIEVSVENWFDSAEPLTEVNVCRLDETNDLHFARHCCASAGTASAAVAASVLAAAAAASHGIAAVIFE